MLYREHIHKALNSIEEKLQEECTLESCASAAGYSVYHFVRIFKSLTGLTPMEYVRKRRLSCAARDIAATKIPLVDIAVQWAFESLESFLRAFAAEHGITPGKYRNSGISLHLTEPFFLPQQNAVEFSPPRIEHFQGAMLCGYPLLLAPEARHGTIPKHWNRFHTQRLARTLPGCSKDDWYDDVGCLTRLFNNQPCYICGIWSDEQGPEGSVLCRIPAGLYAVFSSPPADAFTFVETIHRTWDYAFEAWLPASPYQKDQRPMFETYCEISRTFTEHIYIPIKEKESKHE